MAATQRKNRQLVMSPRQIRRRERRARARAERLQTEFSPEKVRMLETIRRAYDRGVNFSRYADGGVDGWSGIRASSDGALHQMFAKAQKRRIPTLTELAEQGIEVDRRD